MWISTVEMVNGQNYTNVCREVELPPMIGRYDAMLHEFAEIVRGERKPQFDYKHEYEVQKLVLECCVE